MALNTCSRWLRVAGTVAADLLRVAVVSALVISAGLCVAESLRLVCGRRHVFGCLS